MKFRASSGETSIMRIRRSVIFKAISLNVFENESMASFERDTHRQSLYVDGYIILCRALHKLVSIYWKFMDHEAWAHQENVLVELKS